MPNAVQRFIVGDDCMADRTLNLDRVQYAPYTIPPILYSLLTDYFAHKKNIDPKCNLFAVSVKWATALQVSTVWKFIVKAKLILKCSVGESDLLLGCINSKLESPMRKYRQEYFEKSKDGTTFLSGPV